MRPRDYFSRTFSDPPILIGMVHLRALPGSPGWEGDWHALVEAAVQDAQALQSAGFDAVMVENFNDVPFYPAALPPETVAALAVATREVTHAVDLTVGVNALRNDAAAALSVAAVIGARFIRVNVHTGAAVADQGLLQGQAHETLRLRERLRVEVAILADVHVKHAAPVGDASLEEAARDCYHRGLADALIISGSGTGEATALDDLRRAKSAVPEAPVLVGSGVTLASLTETLELADGVIVGSAVMRNGRAGGPVDVERARAFVDAAGK